MYVVYNNVQVDNSPGLLSAVSMSAITQIRVRVWNLCIHGTLYTEGVESESVIKYKIRQGYWMRNTIHVCIAADAIQLTTYKPYVRTIKKNNLDKKTHINR